MGGKRFRYHLISLRTSQSAFASAHFNVASWNLPRSGKCKQPGKAVAFPGCLHFYRYPTIGHGKSLFSNGSGL